jgi:hypothetical protein
MGVYQRYGSASSPTCQGFPDFLSDCQSQIGEIFATAFFGLDWPSYNKSIHLSVQVQLKSAK